MFLPFGRTANPCVPPWDAEGTALQLYSKRHMPSHIGGAEPEIRQREPAKFSLRMGNIRTQAGSDCEILCRPTRGWGRGWGCQIWKRRGAVPRLLGQHGRSLDDGSTGWEGRHNFHLCRDPGRGHRIHHPLLCAHMHPPTLPLPRIFGSSKTGGLQRCFVLSKGGSMWWRS